MDQTQFRFYDLYKRHLEQKWRMPVDIENKFVKMVATLPDEESIKIAREIYTIKQAARGM